MLLIGRKIVIFWKYSYSDPLEGMKPNLVQILLDPLPKLCSLTPSIIQCKMAAMAKLQFFDQSEAMEAILDVGKGCRT
jgi:hypothetical protein